MEKNVIVGIDPSLTTMGVSIYRTDTRELMLGGGDILEALKFIRDNVNMKQAVFVIEDPNMNTNVFNVGGRIKRMIEDMILLKKKPFTRVGKDSPTIPKIMSEIAMALKIAQGVGKNKAAADLTIKILKKAGVPILRINPSDRMVTDKHLKKMSANLKAGIKLLVMPTKSTAYQFEQLTGYKGRSNEHTRDATTLYWGKSIKTILLLIAGQQEDEK